MSVLSPAVYAASLYQVPAILRESEERGLVKRETPGPASGTITLVIIHKHKLSYRLAPAVKAE